MPTVQTFLWGRYKLVYLLAHMRFPNVLDKTLCLGVTGQDCNVTTTVQSGDFCAAIADTAGIPTSLLLQNNPNVLSDCSNIYPGEVS